MAKKPVKKLKKKSVKKTTKKKAIKKLGKSDVSKKLKKVRRTSVKPVKRKAVNQSKPQKSVSEKKVLVGVVEHYFTNIEVCIVKVVGTLKLGDTVSIEGTTTNFKQKIESMEINRVPVSVAKKGDVIGLKVKGRVREKDNVYLAA